MKRFMGVWVGLTLVLALIWLCCGNGVPRSFAHAQTELPQFYRPEPETTALPVVTQPADCYYCGVIVENFQCTGDGVAALEMWNTGDTVVQYVQAVVWQGQRKLTFEATFLPPGGRALVAEKNREPYTLDRITDMQCGSAIRLPKSTYFPVGVEESGACSLTVSNLSDKNLSCVRVFYKEYRRDLGLYAGEITYSLVVTDLPAGESRSFSPWQYSEDTTHVVAVTVEE